MKIYFYIKPTTICWLYVFQVFYLVVCEYFTPIPLKTTHPFNRRSNTLASSSRASAGIRERNGCFVFKDKTLPVQRTPGRQGCIPGTTPPPTALGFCAGIKPSGRAPGYITPSQIDVNISQPLPGNAAMLACVSNWQVDWRHYQRWYERT